MRLRWQEFYPIQPTSETIFNIFGEEEQDEKKILLLRYIYTRNHYESRFDSFFVKQLLQLFRNIV